MGVFDKLKGSRTETDIEEYLNTLGLEEEDLLEEHADMWIKPYVLEDTETVDKVNKELREKNIVLLNIQPLYKKNAAKLRQAIAELKGTAHEIDGDIVRLSEDKVLITPSGVKVYKK